MTKKSDKTKPSTLTTQQKTAKAKAALSAQFIKQLGEALDSPAKQKVIRDSFTLPENDYQLIKVLQERGMDVRMKITKSEVFRAGLHALIRMEDNELLEILGTVEKLKPGRKRKE
jgi:hypothetical protein